MQAVLRVKQSEHLLEYAESVHKRYMTHRLNKDRLESLMELYAALKLPITCDIDWAVSFIRTDPNCNDGPSGSAPVHDAGLVVLPLAAGMPVAGLEPAEHTMTDTALQKVWFETAVATLKADRVQLSPAVVRDAVNALAVAAGRADLRYLNSAGYCAIKLRLRRMPSAGTKKRAREAQPTTAPSNTRQRI